MTPERLEEIRDILEGNNRNNWWAVACGDHQNAAEDLLDEVDRLRAAIERVESLPRFDLDDDMRSHCEDGMYLDADDVLAALEG